MDFGAEGGDITSRHATTTTTTTTSSITIPTTTITTHTASVCTAGAREREGRAGREHLVEEVDAGGAVRGVV